MDNELRVKTNAGELVAYKSVDPEHPGIILMFKAKGTDTEIDLVYAEVKQADFDRDDDNVHVYVYEDCYTEEYTRKFTINRNEVLKALDGE